MLELLQTPGSDWGGPTRPPPEDSVYINTTQVLVLVTLKHLCGEPGGPQAPGGPDREQCGSGRPSLVTQGDFRTPHPRHKAYREPISREILIPTDFSVLATDLSLPRSFLSILKCPGLPPCPISSPRPDAQHKTMDKLARPGQSGVAGEVVERDGQGRPRPRGVGGARWLLERCTWHWARCHRDMEKEGQTGRLAVSLSLQNNLFFFLITKAV